MATRKGAAAKAAAPKDNLPVLTQTEMEALDEQEHTLEQSPVDETQIERTARREVAMQSELGPDSLCGSWALYHSKGGDDTDSKTEQALIVAEPQAGIYLCEFYDLLSDEPREQRIVTVETFAKVDDEGGRWQFFDEHDEVRRAFRRVIA